MFRAGLRLAAVAVLVSLAANEVRADLLTAVILGNRLVTFDSSAPNTLISNTPITGLQSGESVVGLDRRPADGLLYAVGNTQRLYTLNATTAVATQVGSGSGWGLSGALGVDFNPVNDFLRIGTSTTVNVRINPNNGTLIATDSALAYATGDPHAATTPSVVGLAYTNNFAGATTTTLYGIDSALGILVTQSPENAGTLHTVGSLGASTTPNLTSFEISGTSGTAFASLTFPAAANFSQLYSIDLSTGTATSLGSIGNLSAFDAPVVGLAGPIASTPEPSSLTLVGIGGLVGAWLARRKMLNRQDAKD